MQADRNDTCDLWNDFRNGSAQALGQIFDEHIMILYSYGHKFTDNRTFVEDCIQDLFVELWNRRANISPTSSVKFYLFKSLRQKILRQLRSKSVTLFVESYYDISHDIVDDRSSLTEEQQFLVHKAIKGLSPRQKEVVYLKFYNCLSSEEIAEIMGIDKATVYNLVFLSLKALRKELNIRIGYGQLIFFLKSAAGTYQFLNV